MKSSKAVWRVIISLPTERFTDVTPLDIRMTVGLFMDAANTKKFSTMAAANENARKQARVNEYWNFRACKSTGINRASDNELTPEELRAVKKARKAK